LKKYITFSKEYKELLICVELLEVGVKFAERSLEIKDSSLLMIKFKDKELSQ
jgi:hypothetical protein